MFYDYIALEDEFGENIIQVQRYKEDKGATRFAVNLLKRLG